ncbi:hypothetical protein GW17_00055535, partial [Ensete ventricosum]
LGEEDERKLLLGLALGMRNPPELLRAERRLVELHRRVRLHTWHRQMRLEPQQAHHRGRLPTLLLRCLLSHRLKEEERLTLAWRRSCGNTSGEKVRKRHFIRTPMADELL